MSVYSVSDVSSHNSSSSAWLIINGGVFDVTSFLDSHPGGKKILLNVAGKDATKQFNSFHKPETLKKYAKLQIGTVKDEAKKAAAAPTAVAAAPKIPKSLGVKFYGEMIPYGDANWYQGWNSPYYNESHRKVRAAAREFFEVEVNPFVHDWDEQKALPKEIFKRAGEEGFLAGVVGLRKWPAQWAPKILGGIKPEEWDYFHELVLTQEMARAGSASLCWGIAGGLTIGMPPVLHFGSKDLQDRIAPPCLKGEKFICLAITEPEAGSDVAGLCTTAVKSPCGKFYIVNGQKKWITNGVFADYFTTAVRTGGPGHGGVSLLVIERTEGVKTTQMKCQGVWASGTAYVSFEDVKVPVENLVGKEGEGFKYVMENFNHERWGIAAGACRLARVCVEESFKYAFKRKTFGKLLIEHPVIREKLGNMMRQVETCWAQIEAITYQMNTMSFAESQRLLGGPIALIKAHAGIVMENCAREAAQIFGGLAYTRGGQGEKVERIYRDVLAYKIPAGSQEIMIDLAVRQAMKQYSMVLKQTKASL